MHAKVGKKRVTRFIEAKLAVAREIITATVVASALVSDENRKRFRF